MRIGGGIKKFGISEDFFPPSCRGPVDEKWWGCWRPQGGSAGRCDVSYGEVECAQRRISYRDVTVVQRMRACGRVLGLCLLSTLALALGLWGWRA